MLENRCPGEKQKKSASPPTLSGGGAGRSHDVETTGRLANPAPAKWGEFRVGLSFGSKGFPEPEGPKGVRKSLTRRQSARPFGRTQPDVTQTSGPAAGEGPFSAGFPEKKKATSRRRVGWGQGRKKKKGDPRMPKTSLPSVIRGSGWSYGSPAERENWYGTKKGGRERGSPRFLKGGSRWLGKEPPNAAPKSRNGLHRRKKLVCAKKKEQPQAKS